MYVSREKAIMAFLIIIILVVIFGRWIILVPLFIAIGYFLGRIVK